MEKLTWSKTFMEPEMGRGGFSYIHKFHMFVRKSEGNEKGTRISMTFCTFFCKLKKFIMNN